MLALKLVSALSKVIRLFNSIVLLNGWRVLAALITIVRPPMIINIILSLNVLAFYWLIAVIVAAVVIVVSVTVFLK